MAIIMYWITFGFTNVVRLCNPLILSTVVSLASKMIHNISINRKQLLNSMSKVSEPAVGTCL